MPDRRRLIGFAFACCALAGSATAEVTVRDPGTFVVDRAGIMTGNARLQLEGWLKELEQKTTAQVKVLIVPTTDGEDFFGFTQRHFDLWKLGRKGKDNGALIVVAVNDRHVRIQAGYGLEGALPDGWCGAASRDIAVPLFKKGRYSQGVYQLAVATANKVADQANVALGGIPAYRYQRRGRGGALCGGGFVPLFIMFIVFSSISRRGRHHRSWGGGGLVSGLLMGSMMSSMLGGGRSHWGGGGFGGGSFGGGFGGGSFGGGGFSGGGGGGASW